LLFFASCGQRMSLTRLLARCCSHLSASFIMSSPDDQVHSFDDEDEYGEDDAGSDGDADEYGLDYDENDDDDEDFTSYEGAPLDRQTLAAMSSEEVKQILLDSIENANVDLVGSLIEVNCEVNIRDEGGVPALHLAAFEGFTSIAKMLLAAKADVNATDSHGQTALHAAISGGSAQLAQTLIKNGANVDAQDADGATALHYARYYDRSTCRPRSIACSTSEHCMAQLRGL